MKAEVSQKILRKVLAFEDQTGKGDVVGVALFIVHDGDSGALVEVHAETG